MHNLTNLRSLAVCVFLFSCLASAQTTSTLTGSITDSSGNPLNGTLVMRLPVPAQYTPTNKAVAPTPVTYNVLNGAIQGGTILPLYDVAALQPTGLYYIARAYDQTGALQFYGNYVVTGASFNLGAATPTSVTTSNISYILPIFPNQTNIFTATQQFSTITSSSSPVASTGWIRSASTDTACWRNVGNTTDLCVGPTLAIGNDFLSVAGLLIQNNGALISSTPGNSLTVIAAATASGAGPFLLLQADNAHGANTNGGTVFIQPGTKNGAGTNGTTVIAHGVNGGTGFQHKRTASCTTGAGAGSTCNTTVTWPTFFDDTNYTAACTVSGGTGAVTGTPYILNTSSKTTVQITVTIVNLTAVASSGTLDCIGVHD